MPSILRAAASGLRSQQFNLDLIANNIANSATTAYKKTRASFADAVRGVAAATEIGRGPEVGFGVALSANQKIFSAGAITETGKPLDLAVVGNGFFQLSSDDGVTVYTRDGALSVDSEGRLVNAQGLLVAPPIVVPDGAKNIQVDERGLIRAEVNGEMQELGTLSLTTFVNPEGLLSEGHNLYTATPNSGGPRVGQPGTDGRGYLSSGVLENSNVDLAEEMTKAIEAQRAYQLNIKVLQAADEMLGLANNLRR